ncbi:MAG TPA: VCBS repeat-containing protein, partial [Bacteroidota bacterium]|nr:VCBS repeat-containing protein [Bacteroidota bacterium]
MITLHNNFLRALFVLLALTVVVSFSQSQKKIHSSVSSVDTLFTPLSDSIGPLAEGAVAWGDYDNDGALDLFVNGRKPTSSAINYSLIYHNTNGHFVQINDSLVGIHGNNKCAGWVDYNNDGKLDLYLNGSQGPSNTNAIAKIYRNAGSGMFTDITTTILGLAGTSAWGDYNNDNNIDLLATGSPDNGGSILSKIYRNDGNGNFTDIQALLTGVWGASVAWGDYDNDGRQDLIITGLTNNGTSGTTKVYHNNGDGTFT